MKYLLSKDIQCGKTLVVTIDNDSLKLVNLLRKWTYPLGSKEFKTKMEIVKLLEDRCGDSYEKAPIPKKYYELYDEDYLSKY